MDTIIKQEQDKKVIMPVEFTDLQSPSPSEQVRTIGIYMDITKDIIVELGKTKMSIRDILALEVGEVIELSKQAGESVDIFVDNELIAKGEVVVIDDKFGVRITEIVKITDLEKKIV